MIHVDISNIWGELSLPDLLGIESELAAAHMCLSERSGAGHDHLGWLDLAKLVPGPECKRILEAAYRIRESSNFLVVLGTGSGCLGARAVIELMQGTNRNLRRPKGDPRILFAGNDLSTRHWNELIRLLDGRDFSVCVVSRSGRELECGIALRNLRWLLERRYGTANANRRIYAVTDRERGALRRMADEEGWESFCFPDAVTDSFSVLSPAGLLPMAVAGIDVTALLRGASRTRRDCELRSFENPLWLYTAARVLMLRRGRNVELLQSYEPDFAGLGRWWQQLFCSTGSGGGLLPVWAGITADQRGLGEYLLEGPRCMFATMLRFDPPVLRCDIGADRRNADGLNFLSGRTLSAVQEQTCQTMMTAYADCGCPVISIDCGGLSEENLGGLLRFFELSSVLCAYLCGSDPFQHSAIRNQRRMLLDQLGKQDFE